VTAIRLTARLNLRLLAMMKATEAVSALAALAQEHRLAIFRLLVQAGPEGMAPSKIQSRLRLAAPTLSFHLAQLKQAGLVRVLRSGRSLIYTADYKSMKTLVGFLMQNCCGRETVSATHF
jgi:ArsR family transcriptional regulator, arsenate/arsenite/antimonite-responsive transcriptional repressor